MKFKLFLFLLIINFSVFSQTEVYFFKDTSGSLTEKTIKNQVFKLVENQVLQEHSDALFWFKIPAHLTDKTYIFKIVYERINNGEAYQNFKQIEKLKNQRYLSYQFSRNHDFFIKINPKLHSYLPFELYEKEDFLVRENNQLLLNGFYYGFAFLVIIYNFFYFFLFKDDTFLYYSFFLISISYGVFTMDGMLNYFDFNFDVNVALMILNYIALAYFSSKFVNNYLFLDNYYPKFKRVSYTIGSIILILGVFYIFQRNYYYLLSINILVFSLLFMYWCIALSLFSKNIYTKILVFGYVIILFSGIDFFILKFLGISLININATNIKIGAFLEMIILSIAVLYRMKTLKEENEFMTEEIINYSKQLSELVSINKEEDKNNINDLSQRETQIFDLIVNGNTNKEIATELNISVNTVKFHVKNIYEKLNIKSRKEVLTLKKSL